MINLVIDIVLLLFLLIMALSILQHRNLFAVVMLFGLYSLLVAIVFMVLDAPDVAFTEAAVGTGIATVLMLATLSVTKVTHEKQQHKLAKIPFLIVMVTGALLLYGTHDMTNLGDPNAPVHTHVAKRYIQQGKQETGVPNLVTAVLASYRGFDTLGEVTVVLTAGLGILLLLRRKEKPRIKGVKGA
jgi:multicomponent Na+:H+ antiporter subunit B